MGISDHISRIRTGLREGRYTSEAAVSQGIVLPTLNELGWPVFDTAAVTPEYSMEGRRVDFALCHPANRPAVFIEVKKVGFTDGADRQLFEYAFHQGVPMAILTDGQEWSFYLPGEQGHYDERRVYKLDLLERELSEAENRLTRYLSYTNVCSGEALNAARSDYRNVARSREIVSTIPKAWAQILTEPDSILVELLAEKVEDLCGYKPDLDACNQFIISQLYSTKQHERPQKTVIPMKPVDIKAHTRRTGSFHFKYKDREFTESSAIEVLVKLFRFLAEDDSGFPERFAARKHGRKRRYLARDKYELYPGRTDLADRESVEVIPGWWIGTNYSQRSKQKIIDLALEVVAPELRSQISVNVVN